MYINLIKKAFKLISFLYLIKFQVIMKLLIPEERENLIEKICKRFHSDGISRLETVGHFDKYTPLFHFRIAEPNLDSFIYVTELFGTADVDFPQSIKGFRKQYHGDYDGLNAVILQGIYDKTIISPGIVTANAPFIIQSEKPNLNDDDKLKFDNSLRYLNEISKFDTPETMKTNTYSEIFSSTYHIL